MNPEALLVKRNIYIDFYNIKDCENYNDNSYYLAFFSHI